ncbi:MAG TPA: MFS transporter [Caulobacterales bacterium]|nr:MFS transporter [Caulobacterales bacterium]
MQQDTLRPKRLGPILLSLGVHRWHVGVFMLVNTITACLIGIVVVVQPYLLTDVLHIPMTEQGRVTGLLNMAQYGAVALFIAPAGALSDVIGRKPVLIMAIIGFIITLLVLPLVAAVAALFAVRFFLGASSTGHIAGSRTMIVDFPANEDRGKFISLMLVVQSIVSATLVGWLLPHTPAFLVEHGFDHVTALRYSLWGLAALGMVALAIAVPFLRAPPRPAGDAVRKPGFKALIASFREVLVFSRRDPTFGLVLLISFVIRADFFVTQSFMSVWVMSASKLQGIDTPHALKTVGLVSITLTLSAAASPLLLGFLADRVNRVTMLIGSLIYASLAFASTLLVRDVNGIMIIVVFAGIGVAEMAQTVASESVFGERAPPSLRGSAMGLYVFMGTLSVIVVSYLAGILFDKLGFTAPFLFLAALNLVFAAAAIVMIKMRAGMAKTVEGDSAKVAP